MWEAGTALTKPWRQLRELALAVASDPGSPARLLRVASSLVTGQTIVSLKTGPPGMEVPGLDFHMPLAFRALK